MWKTAGGSGSSRSTSLSISRFVIYNAGRYIESRQKKSSPQRRFAARCLRDRGAEPSAAGQRRRRDGGAGVATASSASGPRRRRRDRGVGVGSVWSVLGSAGRGGASGRSRPSGGVGWLVERADGAGGILDDAVAAAAVA